MKLPRDLSGDKLARLLCRKWDYQQINQVGSHIPAHKALRIGTLNGILRTVATHKNVDREDILSSL
jgi:hypothetical protein